MLLDLLRGAAQERKLNAAALAQAADLSREHVHQVLAGDALLTVDDFVALAVALDLGIEAFGLSGELMAPEAEPSADVGDLDEVSDEGAGSPTPLRPQPVTSEGAPAEPGAETLEGPGEAVAQAADPYGVHAAQTFALGFALGCDIFFMAESAKLGASGIPAGVLSRFTDQMPIRLNAAYHKHMDPHYSDEGLTLALSFGALYVCTIPWDAFVQITLFPLPPSPPPVEEPAEDAPAPKPSRGHLRLVD